MLHIKIINNKYIEFLATGTNYWLGARLFFARAATDPALLVTLAMTSIPHFHSKIEFRNGKDYLSRFPYMLVDGSCSSLYVVD